MPVSPARVRRPAPMQRRSLADIIMDKIREKEEGQARAAGEEGDDEDEEGMPRLPPKVHIFVAQDESYP